MQINPEELYVKGTKVNISFYGAKQIWAEKPSSESFRKRHRCSANADNWNRER